MMSKNIIAILVFCLGCGVSHQDYNELLEENKQLRGEIERLKNSPDRQLSEAKLQIDSGNWVVANQKLTRLLNEHPNSEEASEAKKLSVLVERQISLKENASNDKKLKMFRTELLGVKYEYPLSLKIIDKYGSPQTLPGTDNSIWKAYFPIGNFTIHMDKRNSVINKVFFGKVY